MADRWQGGESLGLSTEASGERGLAVTAVTALRCHLLCSSGHLLRGCDPCMTLLLRKCKGGKCGLGGGPRTRCPPSRPCSLDGAAPPVLKSFAEALGEGRHCWQEEGSFRGSRAGWVLPSKFTVLPSSYPLRWTRSGSPMDRGWWLLDVGAGFWAVVSCCDSGDLRGWGHDSVPPPCLCGLPTGAGQGRGF